MSGVLSAVMAASGPPGVFASSLPAGSNAGSSDYQFDNDGNGHTGDGAGGALALTWITPATTTIASYYEVKVDVTAGSFTTGTTGSYLDMGTTRQWVKSSAGTVTFNVTFREKATGIVRKTYTGVSLVVT